MSDLCFLCGADPTAVEALRARVAEVERERDGFRLSLFVLQKAWTEADNRVRGLESEVVLLRKERDEARADMADVQARYARAWEALCKIGEALDAAGYPQLLPERALRVGDGVDAVIRDRDEARSERDARPDPGALLAALDAIRAAAATGARPAELARMIEDVQAGCIRPPTGDGVLLGGERSCFTCEHAHHDICMLLATKPAGTPLGAIYAYCAASGVDDADDNMPTNRSIRCPGWAAKEPK